MGNLNFIALVKERIKPKIKSKLTKQVGSIHAIPLDKFLNLFNVKEVKELNKNDSISAAEDALIDHYRFRKTPSWPSPTGMITDLRLNLEETNNQQLIEKAESILAYQFMPDKKKLVVTGTGDILWHQSPISSPEWLWRLHRHQWWPVLGLAYRLTCDERYAGAFVNQMLSWIESNPMPEQKNEKSFAWRLMECGMRMHVSWIPSFGLFFESPVFDREAKIKMLRSIYDHAQFLSAFKTSQNHLLRESNGLAAVSVYFPEFKQSQRWLQIASTRLHEELKKQINPDGFHFELSTGYQWVVIDEFEKAHALLNIAEHSLQNTSLQRQLEKMYQVLAYMVRPDGTFPEVNDGFMRWSCKRLAKAGKQFKRDDFIYVGTYGNQGVAPTDTSTAFENAGYYVMRSDWSKNAKYLLFDCGPCSGYHGHEDKLSIEVFAFGAPFIVDSGSYTYENTDPFRVYFVGSQGHNTILVNGRGQVRRWIPDYMKVQKSKTKQAIWVSKSDFDYVAGTYDSGYGHFGIQKPKNPEIIEDVTHTRHILFVKSKYWLIVDELASEEHYNYEILFHGHPEVEATIEPGNAVLLRNQKNISQLYLIPAESDKIKVNLITGRKMPIQGWYSLDHHFKVPSTTVIFECEGSKSTVLATLVFPLKSKSKSQNIFFKPIKVSNGQGSAYEVTTDQGTDYLMFSGSNGWKQFKAYKSNGFIAGVRTNKKGEILSQFEASSHDI
jgi:uncharacterized heparinase superfamily protein